MLLLDEVVRWQGEHIVCAATTRPDNPLANGDRLRALVALEYMAQSVAALAGLLSWQRGEAVRIGFLVAVREMALMQDWIGMGVRLLIEADRAWGDRTLGHFHCRVSEGGSVIASASLSVIREDASGLA